MILRSNSCNHNNWCWSRDISISRSWNNHYSYSGFTIFSVHNEHICSASWSFNEWSHWFSSVLWYNGGRGDDMIMRSNIFIRSREWSGSRMMSNWRDIDSFRHVRSTWSIFGKKITRSLPWRWSMYWDGDGLI